MSIPTLSHDYYLGENSGATHYWHGEDRDTQFIETGRQYAVVEDPTGTIHPDMLAHSKKMNSGTTPTDRSSIDRVASKHSVVRATRNQPASPQERKR